MNVLLIKGVGQLNGLLVMFTFYTLNVRRYLESRQAWPFNVFNENSILKVAISLVEENLSNKISMFNVPEFSITYEAAKRFIGLFKDRFVFLVYSLQ